ncbi:auxin-responsive protein iaa27 [Quercus suber]|uniref:Auxin-responsive protein n=1 Tax=Quercus suber TaxID=58331 RepID=A0AAW0J8G2_QUESU
MSIPLEHDYIGLTETSSMERSSEKLSSSTSSTLSTEDVKSSALNLKETELRLGLPGSESPERKVSLFGKDLEDKHNGYPLSPLKNLVSGAKRGFSDAIDGSSGKWAFSMSNGSEVDLVKGAVLFSPRGGNGSGKALGVLEGKSNTQQSSVSATPTLKEAGCVVGWPPIRSFRKNTMASNLVKNSDDADGKTGFGCLYIKVSMDGAPYLRKIDLKTYKNYCSSHGLRGQDGLNESRLKDLLNGSEYVLTYEDKDGDWMLVGDVPWEMFTDSCRRLRIMKGSEAIGLAPRAMEKCKNRN